MSTLNSKTNESNKFMYQFTDKLNLKNPNKNMALANLSIYYTWKIIHDGVHWFTSCRCYKVCIFLRLLKKHFSLIWVSSEPTFICVKIFLSRIIIK